MRNAPDLTVLHEWQAKLVADDERGDVDSYFWHNVAFRQAEAEVVGNAQLARMLNSLGLRTIQLRHVSLSLPGRLDTSVSDHDRLLRLLRRQRGHHQVDHQNGLRAMERSGWAA